MMIDDMFDDMFDDRCEKRLFLTKSCDQIRKRGVLNENRSKDVEKAVPNEMAPP